MGITITITRWAPIQSSLVGADLLLLLHFAQLLLHNQDGFPDTFWQNGPPDSSVRRGAMET